MALEAQNLQGERSVTHFYIVNMDNDLMEILTGNENSKLSRSTGNEFIAGIIDTFYTIAAERLKSEIGLEMLPLAELQNKIKYSKEYPNCPRTDNIKKVLKSASGYKYYMDYFVNIFSDTYMESFSTPPPTRVKPLFAICFTLYDATGKPIEKVDFSYKSRKTLADPNRPTGQKLAQQMKSRLCEDYNDALDGFSVICRRKLTAQL